MTKRKAKMGIAFCAVCGGEFQPKIHTAMYCSMACKQKAYRQKKATQSNAKKKLAVTPGQVVKAKKVCPHCGKHFQPRRSDAIFCSDSCRVVSNRNKQNAACWKHAHNTGLTYYYAWLAINAMGWPKAYEMLQAQGYKWVVEREGWFTEIELLASGKLI